jgi:hypothetical protein
MPIIPVLSPESDYTPPRMAVPDIGDLPAAKRAKLAQGVSDIVVAGATISGQMAEAQGQIEAQKARVGYALDVQKLQKEVLDSPLKPRPGAMAAGLGVPEDENNQVQDGQLGLQPKSETMLKDFETGLAAIDKKYEKGLSQTGAHYFRGPQSRIQVAATGNMVNARASVFDNEQITALKQTTDMIRKSLGELPAQPPSVDSVGIPTYDPEANSRYVAHRALINDTFNKAASLGMSPKVVETLRESEITKLDKDTAEKAMHSDPASWALSSAAGTNLWQKRLDSASMDRLEDRAQAAVTRANADADKQQRKDKEVAEQDLGVMQGNGDIPLAEIQKRARVLGKDVNFWLEARNGIQNGKWDDVPEVKRDLSIRARQFNPEQGIERELNTAFTRHQISDTTHKELMADVKSSRDRQQKLGIDANVRALGREHETARAALYPPPVMASDKGDLAKNYADYLEEFNARVKQEGEAAAPKIAQELKPKYLGRMGEYVASYQTLANTQLPKQIPVDEKGATDPADVQAARKAAFARYGITSKEQFDAAKRAGKVPAGLDNELYNIDQVVTYGRLRSKTTEDAAAVKSGAR